MSFLVWGYLLSAQQECPTTDNTSPCCNGVPISTDPRNGGTQNIERPSIIHKFNWMDPNGWDAYYPNLFSVNGGNYKVANPFFSNTDSYLRHLNFYDFGIGQPQPVEKLDFYPEDGWELLHRQNGLELDETTRVPMGLSQNNRTFPYYILYNKYRGQVRFVGASPRIGSDAQKAVIKMGFVPPVSQGQPRNNVSALMSGSMNNAQTLDQPSQNKSTSMATDYPTIPGLFVGDFTVGYDPCACGRTPDDIQFEFSTLQTADVTMSGRLIGTNVPLDGSGNSPLLNRKDYLLAVNTDLFDVKGGAQTYKNIDGLVERFKQPQVSVFEKLTMDGLKTGISAGLGVLSGGISTGLRSLYCNNAYGSLSGTLQTFGLADANGDPKGFLKDGKLSAGTLAAGADFISGLLFDKPNVTPNITFIEAELALKGKIVTNNAFLVNNIRLAHPGSKSAQANILWQNYPFYNEALGVVSFLKQPKAKRTYRVTREIVRGASEFVRENYTIKLIENLEYYFNPTLDIDLDKTKVFAAFLIDVKASAVSQSQNEPFRYENKIGAFNRVIDSKDTSIVSYITDFYPLECFQDLTGSFEYGKPTNISNQRLRILMDIQYKSNKYGKTNRQNFVYTFPLTMLPTIDNNEFNALENNPKLNQFKFIELVKDQTFTEDTEIRAWQFIGIAGNIQVAAGKKLRLIAPEIEIAPGTQLPPNVEIIAGKTPINCASPSQPVSADRMRQFCSGSEYKANTAPSSATSHQNDDYLIQQVKKASTSFEISPNPFSNTISLEYSVAEDQTVRIDLANALGQTVKSLNFGTRGKGSYQETIETPDLAPGVYFLTLRTQNGSETKKIVKQ